MAGVYSELRGFVLAHRHCTGPRHADVGARQSGYICSRPWSCPTSLVRSGFGASRQRL